VESWLRRSAALLALVLFALCALAGFDAVGANSATAVRPMMAPVAAMPAKPVTVGPPHIAAPTPASVPKPAPAHTAAPAAPDGQTLLITLRPGDTLWALSRHYQTTVADLQAANGLGHSTLIYAWHKLRIPTAHTPAPPTTNPDTHRSTHPISRKAS
jgi:LysM repeat protein